jgi:hypothetical protein
MENHPLRPEPLRNMILVSWQTQVRIFQILVTFGRCTFSQKRCEPESAEWDRSEKFDYDCFVQLFVSGWMNR